MKIYMDVCCLCRPFDDQMMGRIRLEVTAVQEIIRRCATKEFTLVTSEVITEELEKIPDIRKRLRVEKIASVAKELGVTQNASAYKDLVMSNRNIFVKYT
ncbi:MAG: hypothetical protein Q7V05_01035 [Methanoregula sp.]|nr:hypothetical protein [Methanoregula sp.]